MFSGCQGRLLADYDFNEIFVLRLLVLRLVRRSYRSLEVTLLPKTVPVAIGVAA
jgi:hypothetical protein